MLMSAQFNLYAYMYLAQTLYQLLQKKLGKTIYRHDMLLVLWNQLAMLSLIDICAVFGFANVVYMYTDLHGLMNS